MGDAAEVLEEWDTGEQYEQYARSGFGEPSRGSPWRQQYTSR